MSPDARSSPRLPGCHITICPPFTHGCATRSTRELPGGLGESEPGRAWDVRPERAPFNATARSFKSYLITARSFKSFATASLAVGALLR